MKRAEWVFTSLTVLMSLTAAGCDSKQKIDEAMAAPPPAKVEYVPDVNVIQVDRPERFLLSTAGEIEEKPQLNATGVVSPNIERSIPVISLASGRVVGIYAKLGDDVKKGQLLLKVLSNDISSAFVNYNQAKADELLTRKQFDRAQLLYAHGAISQNDLEVAQDAEQKAQASLNAAVQALRTLGADLNHQNPVVNIYAPASGTIVEQNVVNAASVRTPDNQQNLFTIANLGNVWVICDVYENDLSMVQMGDRADVRLNAYPDIAFHGYISNIARVLDPNIRTAKVRIVVSNPGMIRAGMFANATFYGKHGKKYATVPSTAVLHLHDRDWIYVPAGAGRFRRMEVVTGKIIGKSQEILQGIAPGQQLVADALALHTESQP
jgi:cobalt-zinc-cadmium efflux system membrane fusion protein